MSVLLLRCIREIRNGKGLLMRDGASISDADPTVLSVGSGSSWESTNLGGTLCSSSQPAVPSLSSVPSSELPLLVHRPLPLPYS